MGRFEFVVVSSLRAAQLMRGCTAHIDTLGHKRIVTAQREVAGGAIVGTRVPTAEDAPAIVALEAAVESVASA
jgi:DNA-directed RNA polymerase subunit K/omega